MALRNWIPKPFPRPVMNAQRVENNRVNSQLDVLKFLSRDKMKKIDWFDRGVWLSDLQLIFGEFVIVAGRVYRYEIEKSSHVLIPVD